MTNPDYRHIVIMMDRSGSMEKIKTDTEGGLAQFLADQAKQPGRTTVSLHEFDDAYATVYEMAEIGQVPPYTLVPRGSTALYDAVGRTITATGQQLTVMDEDKRPGAVVVVIDTDGHENASREYNGNRIKEMITHQRETYAWEFIFLGADQDAFTAAGAMGIGRGQTLSYASASTCDSFSAVSSMVTRGASGLGYGFTDDERVTASGPTDEPSDLAS